MINTIKLNINDTNSKFFLEIFEDIEKDIFGWDLLSYLSWNKRNRNINYLLIFGR